ncbi:hypothetical protein QRO11_05690 [Paracidovorax citrulli]|uniref:hypothetical protein n=1 Tax=Paracidovorax citrulli TaxID=80869 RepID=UPI0005FC0D38|nr:hypothetical protein [Paracidovorax citrulli]AVS96581.1 hypothetical protein C8232_10235 [Paracidovorax avenae]UMT89410.1 hypothetical protein FRC90_15955 [Paracidovorax citrulli]WIY35832.1 hypothetical protein QRO11_05690 [Paracidovorax citrulli]SDL11898.1 hypothetical protein SAMN04489709_13227 [Paracidovorax citrulli]
MPATNSRTPWPFPTADAHPSPAPGTSTDSPAGGLQVQAVEEDTLDSAVEETFPASDPVSVVSTKSVPADEGAAEDPKATKR